MICLQLFKHLFRCSDVLHPILRPCLEEPACCVCVYLDDILIMSPAAMVSIVDLW